MSIGEEQARFPRVVTMRIGLVSTTALCWRVLLLSVLLAVVLLSNAAIAQSPPAKVHHISYDEAVTLHFPQWDTNRDGRFEANEIETWIVSRPVHGAHAAALATIGTRLRAAPKEVRPKLSMTMAELLVAEGEGPIVKPADPATGTAAHRFSYRNKYKQLIAELDVYTPRLYAHGRPNFEVLKQGPIADCFFFSMTGAIAARHPERIVSMIEHEPKGGFNVKLGLHTIHVREPTDAEALLNNSASTLSDGHWVVILEEAVGRALAQTSKNGQQLIEKTDLLAFGGDASHVIEIYTGHHVDKIPLRDPDHVRDRLALIRHEVPLALAHNRLVGASMQSLPAGGHKTPGLGYDHAYAVMAFEPKADKIRLWNPWGDNFTPKGHEGPEHGYKTQHGIFDVPLREFYDHFSCIRIETDKPSIATTTIGGHRSK